jgi:hypothetical protein
MSIVSIAGASKKALDRGAAHLMILWVCIASAREKRASSLLGFLRKKNKREKIIVTEENRETSCHLVPAKEHVVFLSFVLIVANNLFCVILRFDCIEALGSK